MQGEGMDLNVNLMKCPCRRTISTYWWRHES